MSALLNVMIPVPSPQLHLWFPIAGYDPRPHFAANALDRLLIYLSVDNGACGNHNCDVIESVRVTLLPSSTKQSPAQPQR